jgi:diguanylate cyclase (GGDEF)-like protein
VTRDPALVRARASGERVVAVVRLTFIAAFVTATGPYSLQDPSGLVVALAAIVYATVLLWLAWQTNKGWLSWVSCATDVTLISAALVTYIFRDLPLSALHNRVVFDMYFFAVAAAGLRYDWRLCLMTLLLAVAQFLGIVGYVATHWDLASYVAPRLDQFHAVNIVTRVLVMLAQGGTIVAIASWALHLRLLISRDPLTGLAQRRPFLERIQDEFSRARGGQAPLALAIIDLDEFKKFNDTFGHVAGDDALRSVGACLAACVRGSDLLTRYGGEEFLVAFPGINAEHAVRRAEEIRTRVSTTPMLVHGVAHRLTVSVGIASYPADGRSFDQVFEEADRRLYSAKLHGRNRCVGPGTLRPGPPGPRPPTEAPLS